MIPTVNSPTNAELAHARHWSETAFKSGPLPFSFVFNGQPSAALLQSWPSSHHHHVEGAGRTQTTWVWTDPQGGLEVRCVAVVYSDFPTVEWTVFFKNTGESDTPLLEDIQALDIQLERGAHGEFLLRHNAGSNHTPLDFQPFETPLNPSTKLHIDPREGHGSAWALPYFNLAWPDENGGMGLLVAVGWPGQWLAEFARDIGTALSLRAGQERTHLKLHPGEEIRTPLMALQFYAGGATRAQNIWRRWMLSHNVPREVLPSGERGPGPLHPQLMACSSSQFTEMQNANEENQKHFVDRYLEEGIELDFWWMDAGWYEGGANDWWQTGTWEVDRKRFPNGLRPITDYARSKGVKSLLWFEPERVRGGSYLATQHPEWILGGQLFYLGDPQAWQWMTDRVSSLITSEGVDLYRQDFNIAPLPIWRANDAPDRQGITENHHITGYLAYWDELQKRHPALLFDSCAGGGRRLDLESMRRAVPRTRSDYQLVPSAQQNMTYSLSAWVPYYGNGFMDSVTSDGQWSEELEARSTLFSVPVLCCDMRRSDLHFETLRTWFRQWREIAPNLLGDFYPLTPYDPTEEAWIAWQFDAPERGEGIVQAFRRANSETLSQRLRLQGLDPRARYTVTDFDAPEPVVKAGRELMEEGLEVRLADKGSAALFHYRAKTG